MDLIALKIIIASVREGRGGAAVAAWFETVARADQRFDVRVLDLADIQLPLSTEPNHPRLSDYIHQHTRDWSEAVKEGEAFVIVTPEYNFSIPASLKNALDYLHVEWQRKAVGLVTYGGISGGLRCAEHLRSVLGALGMFQVKDGVVAPLYATQMEDGRFQANEVQIGAAGNMLDQIAEMHEFASRNSGS